MAGLFKSGQIEGSAPFRGRRARGFRPWQLSAAEFFAAVRCFPEAELADLELSALQLHSEPVWVRERYSIRVGVLGQQGAALAYYANDPIGSAVTVIASRAQREAFRPTYETIVLPEYRRQGIGYALAVASYWFLPGNQAPRSVTRVSAPMILKAHAAVVDGALALGLHVPESASSASRRADEHAEILHWAGSILTAPQLHSGTVPEQDSSKRPNTHQDGDRYGN